MGAEIEGTAESHALRLRTGWLALIVGVMIFAGKFTAYALTGSMAVFADALESTVNIVSAGMLLFALHWAAKPPDRDHPYGHGRIEFLSAAIEGTAIIVASLVIFGESLRELIQGPELASLDIGLAVLGVCTIGNLALGRHLVRVGDKTDSIALVADGRHIMSDVWTSVGVIGGLLIVRVTGFVWADPMIAMAVALNVAREGVSLMRIAIGGLMDEADTETLDAAVALLDDHRTGAWIEVHSLRSWRSGARRHFDLHLTVPRYFDVDQIHAIHDEIEVALLSGDAYGDVVVHFDPCTPALCKRCQMPQCPVREADFEALVPFTKDRLTRSDEQVHGGPTESPTLEESDR